MDNNKEKISSMDGKPRSGLPSGKECCKQSTPEQSRCPLVLKQLDAYGESETPSTSGEGERKFTESYKDLPETAEVTGDVEEIVDPEKTNERIWFSLQKGDVRFKIGLTDVLLCLKFAEKIGEIPPLPSLWWDTIEKMYPHDWDFADGDD